MRIEFTSLSCINSVRGSPGLSPYPFAVHCRITSSKKASLGSTTAIVPIFPSFRRRSALLFTTSPTSDNAVLLITDDGRRPLTVTAGSMGCEGRGGGLASSVGAGCGGRRGVIGGCGGRLGVDERGEWW